MRFIFAALVFAGVAHAGMLKRTVGWSEVPPPAQATILREARGAQVVKVQREFDHGRMLWEAKVRYPGEKHKTKIEVTPAGDLIHIK